MKRLLWTIAVGVLPLACFYSIRAQTAPARPAWAFLTPDKEQPQVPEEKAPIRIPASSKSYTAAEIDNLSNPPDWFPEEHGALPKVVQGGPGSTALACGACHLMSGQGHPESADLAGLPVEYLVRQMVDFRDGKRIDPARMNAIAKVTSDEDIRKAAEWGAALKPVVWVKVMESSTVPKSYVSTKGRMRLPHPAGGTEPLGKRIIELPQDPARATSRDPHSGFVAYVPPGSIAKGETLVKSGGSGKTIACTICHGDDLKGLGDVPRIAGLHPVYIVRQLYGFQGKDYSGTSAALMRKVVARLDEDDMIAIAAYAASLAP
ncbi:MAG: cytochrome C [Terriglobia bacterium]|nr:MAG: cytochrome C [Terriglobia bacterium]